MPGVLHAALAGWMVVAGAGTAAAQTGSPDRTVPQHLTIGYDHEGKIDAQPQACLAFVKDITEWDTAQTEKGARDVCAARKRHVDAYDALQATYRNFVKAFSVDRRLSLPESVESFKALVKACIAHKVGLTTGGHNIMIDIIRTTS